MQHELLESESLLMTTIGALFAAIPLGTKVSAHVHKQRLLAAEFTLFKG